MRVFALQYGHGVPFSIWSYKQLRSKILKSAEFSKNVLISYGLRLVLVILTVVFYRHLNFLYSVDYVKLLDRNWNRSVLQTELSAINLNIFHLYRTFWTEHSDWWDAACTASFMDQLWQASSFLLLLLYVCIVCF